MKNIAIFGVPRSGTSWLGQIFNSSPVVSYRYQPIFAYSFPENLSVKSSSKEIDNFHSELLKTSDDFVCQTRNISGNKTPKFKKEFITHLVWKEVRYLEVIENLINNSDTKIIGIVRHPCGVLKSWMNAPKEFETDWNILREWRLASKKNKNNYDYYGFEKWSEATDLFLKMKDKYPDQFSIVRYEDLLFDPRQVSKKLFDICELQFEQQTEEFIKQSTSRSSSDPYGVFRKDKKMDEWKVVLPTDIIESILEDNRFKRLSKYLNNEFSSISKEVSKSPHRSIPK
ncbi:MAG: sulfotransferase [Balneolaceae bacterium]